LDPGAANALIKWADRECGDNDGQISFEEYVKMLSEAQAHISSFKAMDVNNDGHLGVQAIQELMRANTEIELDNTEIEMLIKSVSRGVESVTMDEYLQLVLSPAQEEDGEVQDWQGDFHCESSTANEPSSNHGSTVTTTTASGTTPWYKRGLTGTGGLSIRGDSALDPAMPGGPTSQGRGDDRPLVISEAPVAQDLEFERVVRASFERYDFDNSGTINSSEELVQLSLNLVYKLSILPPIEGERSTSKTWTQDTIQSSLKEKGMLCDEEHPLTVEEYLPLFRCAYAYPPAANK